MEIKPTKVTTTISNLKTKEKYKTEEEWKAKGIPEKDIRRDVHVLMPALDLFGKTKQVQNLGEIMTKSQRQPYVEGGVASLRQPFFLGFLLELAAQVCGEDQEVSVVVKAG